MSIVVNMYSEVTPEGKLFGKLGFQTMSPKTDRNILANMSALEAALDANVLEDLDGNKVDNQAIVWLPCLVTRVTEEADRQSVSQFRTNSGYAAVPAKSESTDGEDIPF